MATIGHNVIFSNLDEENRAHDLPHRHSRDGVSRLRGTIRPRDLELYREKLRELDQLDEKARGEWCELHDKFYAPDFYLPEGQVIPEVQTVESIKTNIDMQMSKQMYALDTKRRLLKDYRAFVQHTINTLTRPIYKPFTILDFPDEVLINIFQFVKGFSCRPGNSMEEWDVPPEMSPYGSEKDVKALRLTCRRFCSTSSHLLLHFLQLDMTPLSLARFKEVSSHPTISKGIQAVRMGLYCYDSVLAVDLAAFAEYNVDRLTDAKERKEEDDRRIITRTRPWYEGSKEEAERVLRDLETVDAILEAWAPLSAGELHHQDSEEGANHRRRLIRAHNEYRRRFKAQEKLKNNGLFYRAIAEGFAKMPHARLLELYGEHDQVEMFTSGRLFGRKVDIETLIQTTLTPISWEEARINELGSPSTLAIYETLMAIRHAGVYLKELRLRISTPENLSTLMPDGKEAAKDLTSAMQQLEKFEFSPSGHAMDRGTGEWPPRQLKELEDLKRFLLAIIDTPTLTSMGYNLGFLWCKELFGPPTFSLGSLLALRTWPKLDTVRFFRMPVHFEELETFVNQLRRPLDEPRFNDMHLLSGSWVDTLDLFRKVQTVNRELQFWDPAGGECDFISRAEHKSVFFGPTRSKASNAELYVRGKIDKNPMRELLENRMDTAWEDDEDLIEV